MAVRHNLSLLFIHEVPAIVVLIPSLSADFLRLIGQHSFSRTSIAAVDEVDASPREAVLVEQLLDVKERFEMSTNIGGFAWLTSRQSL